MLQSYIYVQGMFIDERAHFVLISDIEEEREKKRNREVLCHNRSKGREKWWGVDINHLPLIYVLIVRKHFIRIFFKG